VGGLVCKRAFDILLSSIILLVCLPLFAVVAILIKVTSPGPVFFRQKRVGLNGRIFYLYKFRTMVKDAELKLAELLPHNEINGPGRLKLIKRPAHYAFRQVFAQVQY